MEMNRQQDMESDQNGRGPIVSITYMGLKGGKRMLVECSDNIYRKWAMKVCCKRF